MQARPLVVKPSTAFPWWYDDVSDDAIEVVIVSKAGDSMRAEELTLG